MVDPLQRKYSILHQNIKQIHEAIEKLLSDVKYEVITASAVVSAIPKY